MRAGQLRDRVEVQRPVRDPKGGPTRWETEHASVPAEVVYLRGRELFEARGVVARAVANVRIRYLEGFDSERRLVHAGKPLNVSTPPAIDARRTEMEFLCEEGQRG